MEGYIQISPGSTVWCRAHFGEVLEPGPSGGQIARPVFSRYLGSEIITGAPEEVMEAAKRKFHGDVKRFEFEGGRIAYGVLDERTPPDLGHVISVGLRNLFRRT